MESEPVPEPSVVSPIPQEEQTWAMLAHLSVLLNLISGVLGVVAALVIYLVYQDRSRYVAYHGLQSFFFQLIFWLGGGVLVGLVWTVVGLMYTVVIGFCFTPIALLISFIPVGAIVYGVVGGIQCSQGQDFRYWLVGDWVRGTLVG